LILFVKVKKKVEMIFFSLI